ncbi:MAG: hypothetical protein ABIH00_04130 [Armatimonadota bacterium]
MKKINFTKFLTVIILFLFLFTCTCAAEEAQASFSNDWFSIKYPSYFEKEIDPQYGTITLSNSDESCVIKMEKMIEGTDPLGDEAMLKIQDAVAKNLEKDGYTFLSGDKDFFQGYPGRKMIFQGIVDENIVKMQLLIFQRDKDLFLFGFFTYKKDFDTNLVILNDILNSVVFK